MFFYLWNGQAGKGRLLQFHTCFNMINLLECVFTLDMESYFSLIFFTEYCRGKLYFRINIFKYTEEIIVARINMKFNGIHNDPLEFIAGVLLLKNPLEHKIVENLL